MASRVSRTQDSALAELARECGLQPQEPGTIDEAFESVVGEHTLLREAGRSSRSDGAAISLLGAGIYDYFCPALVDAKLPAPARVNEQTRSIEQALADLTEMPACRLFGEDMISLLARLLTSLGERQEQPRVKVLLSAALAPGLRQALQTQLKFRNIDAGIVGFDDTSGVIDREQLKDWDTDGVIALVFAWPNFFGLTEALQALLDWSAQGGVKLVAMVNPLLLSLLRSPAGLALGRIDYLVGDCQSLGLPVSKGGQAPSFVATSVQAPPLPDIIGGSLHTVDLARVDAWLQVQGVTGMRAAVERGRELLRSLVDRLDKVAQVSLRFSSPWLHECVLRFDGIDIDQAVKILGGDSMLAGFPLDREFPQLSNCLLLHCNDRLEETDIEAIGGKLETAVRNLSTDSRPVGPKRLA